MPFLTELARCVEDIIAQLDRIDEGHKRMNITMSRTSDFHALEEAEHGET